MPSQEDIKITWYQLVNKEGLPFKGTNSRSIMISVSTSVVDFLKLVLNENSGILTETKQPELQVFSDKKVFDKKESLSNGAILNGLETTKDNPLIVSVEVEPSGKPQPTALQKLISEQKGKTTYTPNEAFLLHVFWEAPNLSSAERLLDGLEKCAQATHRDTPCVPTYFFRISTNDEGLYGDAPIYVKDHVQLSSAIKKLNVGIPRGAIISDLIKRGIDPKYLELDLSARLPESLQNQKPIAVEFTELYLDERAFMEHAGSRDYLDGYGVVMSPGMSNRLPTTLRFGTPNQNMIEKILEPMLKENVMPLIFGSTVWQAPKDWSESSFLISLDFETPSLFDNYSFPNEVSRRWVWSVRFSHPIRSNTTRLMTVFSSYDSLVQTFFEQVASMKPLRGEIHAGNSVEKLTQTIADLGLPFAVNASKSSGYVLHKSVGNINAL